VHGNKGKGSWDGNAIAKPFASGESASGDDTATTTTATTTVTSVRSNLKKERETQKEIKKNRENEGGEGKRSIERDRHTERALQRQSDLKRAESMEKHTMSDLKQSDLVRKTAADTAHRVRREATLTRHPIKLTRSKSLEDISLPKSKSLDINSERVPPARLRASSPSPMITVTSLIAHTLMVYEQFLSIHWCPCLC